MTDEATLLQALAELGYTSQKVEVHKTAQALMDYHGLRRPEKAHIIIRRRNTGASASNDIGFVRLDNGAFKAIVSEYDRDMIRLRGNTFVDAVKNTYARLNLNREMQTVRATTIPLLDLQGLLPEDYEVAEVETETEIKLVLRKR